MKNIFFALVIMFADFAACDTPQPTTGSSTDSTTNNNKTDTTGTMQRDTTQKP
jgi:hypothetical protein